MGAFSTLYVSRKAAMLKVAEHLLGGFSDEDLAAALGHRFRHSLYNFRVGYQDDDDRELERL